MLVSQLLLFITPTLCLSGVYDVNEVRSTLYEPDIHFLLAGIDPSFNLSTLSAENKDSVYEKILSDLSTIRDDEYLFVKSKGGQNFACRLPKVQAPEKVRAESYNPKYLAELVSASFYVKNCISKENGWWNYKLCRGIDIKQWHGAKNEAAQITNSLGIFLGKYGMPSYETSTPERLMYLEEHYEGGTPCDLPDKKSPRKTAVRYECDPQLSTSEAYIQHVEEEASCEYVITVKVGSLCSLSAFMPPNLIEPNKIICQPFVSKEVIEKFLVDTIRKKEDMKEAASRARKSLELVQRIQRRRAAMRRTELLRDPSSKTSALRSYIDNEYQTAVKEYMKDALQARTGDSNSEELTNTVGTLSREIDDIDRTFYSFDYDNERDQDAGSLWYYFHDNSWNKTHFPKSLDYVDIMNGYYEAAAKLVTTYHRTAMALVLFPLLRKDPWNYNENLLLHSGLSTNLRSAALQDVPFFVAPNGEDSLDFEMVHNVASGHGLFGFRSSSVINAFMKHVRSEFVAGVEPGKSDDTVEISLASQLIPAYKFIELTLMQDKLALPENVRRNLENDMVSMLDRLCVAYQLAQIRYNREDPNHKLSFKGEGAGTKATVLFDDYYQSVVKTRSEKDKEEVHARLKQVMSDLFNNYTSQIFKEQWFTLSEMLLYKKREADSLKYGKFSRDILKNSFLDGKIMLTNTDWKEIMSLISSVGLQVDDIKMEVIATNTLDGSSQKFTSDDMRLLQEVIKRQIDDIKDMKRITQREQAYGTDFNK